MTNVLDGLATSKQIQEEVAYAVAQMKSQHGLTPGLAAILVGEDPGSTVYVRNKSRACEEVGIYTQTFNLSADISQKDLGDLVDELNQEPKFHGILTQLPMPSHIDEGQLVATVSPLKDVDCLHPINVGRLVQGRSDFVPATPGGIQQLLIRNGYDPGGKHLVICGRSNIVGKPLALLMMQKSWGGNATVTVCHTGTPNLAELTKEADILVAAIGSPNSITVDMVKEGSVVVDVGINRVADSARKLGYRLVGDVDYKSVFDKVEAITPVPGGVGPMTIATLLSNTVTAAKLTIDGRI